MGAYAGDDNIEGVAIVTPGRTPIVTPGRTHYPLAKEALLALSEENKATGIGPYPLPLGDEGRGIVDRFLEDCFVATAVYGDVNAPQVEVLREFRDNVLTDYTLGRAFVEFYYSGAGKRAAQFIEEKLPAAIPIIRRGLDFFVERYSIPEQLNL